jgi:cell division cycle 14
MAFVDEDAPQQKQSSQYIYFTNDKSFVFTSFFADFGPLDLGHTHKFCTQLQETMTKAKDKHKAVVYSCSNHPHHRANGAVMICAYMVRLCLI